MNTYRTVTADDVNSAIEAMGDPADPGTWPNVNAIRDHLGRGSWTTIQKHLTAARQQARRAAAHAPTAIEEMMQRCAADIWRLAAESAQSQHNNALEQARDENAALSERLTEHEEHIHQALAEVQRLEEALAEATALSEERAKSLEAATRCAAEAAAAHQADIAVLQARCETLEQSRVALEQQCNHERHAHQEAMVEARQEWDAQIAAVRSDLATTHEQHAAVVEQLHAQIDDLRSARNLAISRAEASERHAQDLDNRLEQALAARTADQEQMIAVREDCAALRAQKDAAIALAENARRDREEIMAMLRQQGDSPGQGT